MLKTPVGGQYYLRFEQASKHCSTMTGFSLPCSFIVILIAFTQQASYSRGLQRAVDDADVSSESVSSTQNMVIAQIDLYQYKQEEIDVEVQDMKIYVKGRHVTERENGYDASEFERFYAVPEGVDPKRVSTRYADGMLKIEAPCPKRKEIKNLQTLDNF